MRLLDPYPCFASYGWPAEGMTVRLRKKDKLLSRSELQEKYGAVPRACMACPVAQECRKEAEK